MANQTVDVNLEAYNDGIPVDLDTIAIAPGFLADPLNFSHTSTGKYHVSYMINESDLFFGSLSFYGTADTATDSATVTGTYSLGGGLFGSAWEVTVRATNGGALGLAAGPGTTVDFEARSYLSGVLAEGGPINFTVTWSDGTTEGNGTLPATQVQAGVYRASVQVPADLMVSRMYDIEAALGSGLFRPSSTTGFAAHPFSIFALVTSSTLTSATLRVFVGSSSPTVGANVSLQGSAMSLSYPFTATVVGPFAGTTDANGQTTLNPTWGLGAPALWYLNVTSAGKKTSTLVTLMTEASGPWMPSPAIGFGCEVNIQTDASGLHAGQTAVLVFRVTFGASLLNPQPVVSQNIDRYVWRDGEGGTTQGGAVMTDATGNFTLTYAIPANWTWHEALHILVVCPDGTTGTTQVSAGPSSPIGSGALTVTASGKLGGAVTITATYAGSNPLTGALAYAAIIPGNQTTAAGVGLAGGGLTATLTRSGSTFTGSVIVPAWLGEGDYSVLVMVSNLGATSSKSDQTAEVNGTALHLTPQGSTGGNSNNPAPKGFLPGFEGAATVAALGALAFVLVAGRRRRAD